MGSLALCLMTGGAAHASDADCTAILDAIVKVTATSVHQKISIQMPNGKPPLQTEVIHIKDTMYTRATGPWAARPYDGAKVAADARQAMAASEHTCSRDGSEPVDGQPALGYRMDFLDHRGLPHGRRWYATATLGTAPNRTHAWAYGDTIPQALANLHAAVVAGTNLIHEVKLLCHRFALCTICIRNLLINLIHIIMLVGNIFLQMIQAW